MQSSLIRLHCRVGMRPPSVEVRFKDLYVETQVYADLSRNLPSVIGFYRESIEVGAHSLERSHAPATTEAVP